MKVEIRNISLKSLVFSAYPLAVFSLSLLSVLLALPEFSADNTLFKSILEFLMNVISLTAAMLVLSLLTVFIYNLFCSFGIKGIKFEIEEVEESSKQDEEQN
ncbi:MAG: hypothetical protein LBG46_04865 [Elusimicrobiota bacterium]|jgi:hypothetical protein|nr:hypothetical protein [Elusimicrobiota bacterium]